MLLTKVFAQARRSIVAFGSKVAVARKRGAPPFPTLIGTGFVVDERGIVATNRHVVRALEKLPANPKTRGSTAFALAYSEVQSGQSDHYLKIVFAGIRRWDKLTTFESTEQFYGEQLPDLAFVQLNVSGLPALPLATTPGLWEPGTPISTAGFPLGKDALTIYGRINQVVPILRSGIIASVYPFPCPKPHGFTIDIMTLGGESGSPIFIANEATAIGLLHAGFDMTNITLALPSWLIALALRDYLKSVPLDFNGVPSFDDLTSDAGSSTLDWEAI